MQRAWAGFPGRLEKSGKMKIFMEKVIENIMENWPKVIEFYDQT